LPREMKLDPRFLVLDSLKELDILDIKRRATGQLKEYCLFVGL